MPEVGGITATRTLTAADTNLGLPVLTRRRGPPRLCFDCMIGCADMGMIGFPDIGRCARLPTSKPLIDLNGKSPRRRGGLLADRRYGAHAKGTSRADGHCVWEPLLLN